MNEVNPENVDLLRTRDRLADRTVLLTTALDQWVNEPGGLREDEFNVMHDALALLHDLSRMLERT